MHRKLIGDCFLHIPRIQKVDLILSDPPYGTTQQEWDEPVEWARWWELVSRFACPVLLFAAPPFDKDLAHTNRKDYRYDWIWAKNRATGHLNAKKRPLQSHEQVLVFYKQPPNYFPQKTTGHKKINHCVQKVHGELYGSQKPTASTRSTDRFPLTVQHFDAIAPDKKEHPNQKPQELLRYLIRTYSQPGDVILDPFAGSRSTGFAAEAEGRDSITIERNPECSSSA